MCDELMGGRSGGLVNHQISLISPNWRLMHDAGRQGDLRAVSCPIGRFDDTHFFVLSPRPYRDSQGTPRLQLTVTVRLARSFPQQHNRRQRRR